LRSDLFEKEKFRRISLESRESIKKKGDEVGMVKEKRFLLILGKIIEARD